MPSPTEPSAGLLVGDVRCIEPDVWPPSDAVGAAGCRRLLTALVPCLLWLTYHFTVQYLTSVLVRELWDNIPPKKGSLAISLYKYLNGVFVRELWGNIFPKKGGGRNIASSRRTAPSVLLLLPPPLLLLLPFSQFSLG